ncbi:hypothetical protein CRG98_017340 [Punica granatum]|uniref:Uncharacterized protein n=1 Tax=Punica granatum TaxID=22663 RepID=A0A2I0K2A8_PUNGR|nr:hypothetical protein CRG98_017340 [Punica granatum]
MPMNLHLNRRGQLKVGLDHWWVGFGLIWLAQTRLEGNRLDWGFLTPLEHLERTGGFRRFGPVSSTSHGGSKHPRDPSKWWWWSLGHEASGRPASCKEKRKAVRIADLTRLDRPDWVILVVAAVEVASAICPSVPQNYVPCPLPGFSPPSRLLSIGLLAQVTARYGPPIAMLRCLLVTKSLYTNLKKPPRAPWFNQVSPGCHFPLVESMVPVRTQMWTLIGTHMRAFGSRDLGVSTFPGTRDGHA